MAHNIMETDNMISVKERPWHGLGVILDDSPSDIPMAMQLAGLDWNVGKIQLHLPTGEKVDRFAVIRDRDKRVLGTVGPNWEPIQNLKAFSPLEPFIQAGHATIETAGSLFNGSRVWMLLKVNKPNSVIVPNADDTVAKYLLATVGHDGLLAFRLGYSPVRVVCHNTLSVALRQGEQTHVRIKHSRGAADTIDALTSTIQEVDSRFESTAEVFRALAGVQVKSAAQLLQYVKTCFSAKVEDPGIIVETRKSRVFDNVAKLFENGRGNTAAGVAGTAWAAYNAVTEYNTWFRGHNDDSRLNNLWIVQGGAIGNALPAAVDTFLT